MGGSPPPGLLSAAVRWVLPALLPTQAATNLFPLLKEQPLFISSGLDIRGG